MAVFNVMFPVLPGKEDAARAWIEEFSGPRRAGFDELQRRSEIERETLTLLKTPMGSFLLVWFDGDIEKAFGALLSGDDECTAHSDLVLYRFDDRALEEVLAADPQLGAGLSALAAARQAALDGSGSPSSLAPGQGAAEPSVRLIPRIRRLFGQR